MSYELSDHRVCRHRANAPISRAACADDRRVLNGHLQRPAQPTSGIDMRVLTVAAPGMPRIDAEILDQLLLVVHQIENSRW